MTATVEEHDGWALTRLPNEFQWRLGYTAVCIEHHWRGNFHAIGLESAPNAEALHEAFDHNYQHNEYDGEEDA